MHADTKSPILLKADITIGALKLKDSHKFLSNLKEVWSFIRTFAKSES